MERQFGDESTTLSTTTRSNNFIVLDSASGCLSSNLYGDGDGGSGSALMNEVSLALRRLSRRNRWVRLTFFCRNAVFVINGVVSTQGKGGVGRRGGRYKPALGESWRVADVRILLDIYGDVYDDRGHGDVSSDGVAGMCRSSMRRVGARLERHYAKKCDGTIVKFGIDSSGIVDDGIALPVLQP